MEEGGLTNGDGKGIRAIQKVRLMHAAIRRLILHPPPPPSGIPPQTLREVLLRMHWNTEELGQPINQEDMAFTLLTFSYVILRSLKRLGIKVTNADAEAYLHCWNVVGFIMGVDRRLTAANFKEAEALFWRTVQMSPAASWSATNQDGCFGKRTAPTMSFGPPAAG